MEISRRKLTAIVSAVLIAVMVISAYSSMTTFVPCRITMYADPALDISLGQFMDCECTTPFTSYDWDGIVEGETYECPVYVKNTGTMGLYITYLPTNVWLCEDPPGSGDFQTHLIITCYVIEFGLPCELYPLDTAVQLLEKDPSVCNLGFYLPPGTVMKVDIVLYVDRVVVGETYEWEFTFWGSTKVHNPRDRSSIKILVEQDDRTGNEWADEWLKHKDNPGTHDDTWEMSNILSDLGYAVVNAEESDLLATYATVAELADYYRTFDVVWFSNPGISVDDAITISALRAAMESGVGIVMQGDDIMWTELRWGTDMTPLTGLDPYGAGLVMNGIDNGDGKTYDNRYYHRGITGGGYYEVTIGTGHAIQTGLEGQTFEYGDDMDLATVASGYGATPVLTATPVPSGYHGDRPTVAAYVDSGGNREVTVLLALTQPEVTTDIDVSKLCDNIVLWVSGTIS